MQPSVGGSELNVQGALPEVGAAVQPTCSGGGAKSTST